MNTSLRRGRTTDLLDFFPATRKTVPELVTFFKSQKLDIVADWYQKQRSAEVSKATLGHLKDMVQGQESNEEVNF